MFVCVSKRRELTANLFLFYLFIFDYNQVVALIRLGNTGSMRYKEDVGAVKKDDEGSDGAKRSILSSSSRIQPSSSKAAPIGLMRRGR